MVDTAFLKGSRYAEQAIRAYDKFMVMNMVFGQKVTVG